MTKDTITLYEDFTDILSAKLDDRISTEDFTRQIRSLHTEVGKAIDAVVVASPSNEYSRQFEELETLAKKVLKYV